MDQAGTCTSGSVAQLCTQCFTNRQQMVYMTHYTMPVPPRSYVHAAAATPAPVCTDPACCAAGWHHLWRPVHTRDPEAPWGTMAPIARHDPPALPVLVRLLMLTCRSGTAQLWRAVAAGTLLTCNAALPPVLKPAAPCCSTVHGADAYQLQSSKRPPAIESLLPSTQGTGQCILHAMLTPALASRAHLQLQASHIPFCQLMPSLACSVARTGAQPPCATTLAGDRQTICCTLKTPGRCPTVPATAGAVLPSASRPLLLLLAGSLTKY